MLGTTKRRNGRRFRASCSPLTSGGWMRFQSANAVNAHSADRKQLMMRSREKRVIPAATLPSPHGPQMMICQLLAS